MLENGRRRRAAAVIVSRLGLGFFIPEARQSPPASFAHVAGGHFSSGTLNVSSGTANSTTVNAGGFEFVFSGGTASGTTLNGGTEVVSSGGAVGGTVTFGSSGGLLILEHSSGFVGQLGGFTSSSDQIDLADIAFGSGTTVSFVEASDNTSGTLTVSDGVHSAAITVLGNHVTSNFTAVSDGNGGTLIFDPPVSGSSAAGSVPGQAGDINAIAVGSSTSLGFSSAATSGMAPSVSTRQPVTLDLLNQFAAGHFMTAADHQESSFTADHAALRPAEMQCNDIRCSPGAVGVTAFEVFADGEPSV